MNKEAGKNPLTTVSVSYTPYRMDLPMPGGLSGHDLHRRGCAASGDGGDQGENDHRMGRPGGASRKQPAGRFRRKPGGRSLGVYVRMPGSGPVPGDPHRVALVEVSESLDSMIGFCKNRSFSILYPGSIIRDSPRAMGEAHVVANYVIKSNSANGVEKGVTP